MIDLRNLGGGKKLIKEIIQKNNSSRVPWSKQNQYKAVKKQKNLHTPASRNSKPY